VEAAVPLTVFRRALCEAWQLGFNISRLPELLGVSRPTYYKLLRGYTSEQGIRIRFVANVEAFGYRVVLVEGPSRGGAGAGFADALDLGSMHKVAILYVEAQEARAHSSILDLLGLNAIGPLTIKRVYCPPTGTVVEARPRHYKPRWEETLFAMEASESFTTTRELAAKLGLSWQRVTRLLLDSKRKGTLVAPLIYPEPSSDKGTVGVVVVLDEQPDPGIVWSLSEWPLVELTGENGGPPYVLLGVASITGVLALANRREPGVIRRILLSPRHPLPPFKPPHTMPRPPARPWRAVPARQPNPGD